MPISIKTKIMLWGRAAHRCSFAECRRELAIDSTSTDDVSLIGEVCHIVAESVNGPRGDATLSAVQRDKYANLILLCNVHHKVVDDLPVDFTVERIHAIKAEHERWVRETLQGGDPQRQRDDEVYAAYVEEWSKRCELDEWVNWSSSVLGHGQPSMLSSRHANLHELCRWLLARVWPRRHPDLEAAFDNFRHVLTDLLRVFDEHADTAGNRIQTRKFYQLDGRRWSEELEERLSRKYDYHVDLVMDLMLELTRAANFVCDRVRESIDPSFRLSEGVALATAGPYDGLTWHHYRVEYRGAERVSRPYPGLAGFKPDRKQRDRNFGEEVSTLLQDERNREE